MKLKLPAYKPTRYTLYLLLFLTSVVVFDFVRAIMKGGFITVLVLLLFCFAHQQCSFWLTFWVTMTYSQQLVNETENDL